MLKETGFCWTNSNIKLRHLYFRFKTYPCKRCKYQTFLNKQDFKNCIRDRGRKLRLTQMVLRIKKQDLTRVVYRYQKQDWRRDARVKNKIDALIDSALSLVVKLYVIIFYIKLDYQSKGKIHILHSSPYLQSTVYSLHSSLYLQSTVNILHSTYMSSAYSLQ